MNYNRYTISILLLACFLQVQSQTEEKKKQVEFKLSANYNSGLNYFGRVDSLRSSGFYPMAELWFNESFYINAAPVVVNNSVDHFKYNGTITTIGYQFNADNKWFGNIYFIKPFYQASSELVQSALKAQTGMTLTWLNEILNVTGGGDIKFSDRTDYGVVAGLDHIFRWQVNEKSVLVIDPSAYLNAGTQQFTKTYLKQNSPFLLFPGQGQSVTESAQKFNILSYEFMMPVVYAVSRYQLLFTPAYVIPQNLLTVESRPDLSEYGEKMFYATIGAKISF